MSTFNFLTMVESMLIIVSILLNIVKQNDYQMASSSYFLNPSV